MSVFFCHPGNGYITTEVLREILSELDNNMSDDELDQMIDEIDADGSGTVDFDGKSYTHLKPFFFFNFHNYLTKIILFKYIRVISITYCVD